MNIDKQIIDCVIERPYEFQVKDKVFYLYPLTLGKMSILEAYISALGIQQNGDTNLEFLYLAKEKKEVCCTIIAYYTLRTKEEIFSSKLIKERCNFFRKELEDEDIATLLIKLLSNNELDSFISYTGLDREHDKLRKVNKIKESKTTLSYCGKTIYGSFIHPLLEMGFTWNEIVWERSYTNLRMLLYDKPVSVFTTDDEYKKIPKWALPSQDVSIKADDPKNKELIRSMDWK